jgi:hypothetical protein
MAPDFLDEARSQIDARLRELQPVVDEYRRLEAAAAALAAVHAGPPVAGFRRPGSGSARHRQPGGATRTRPKGGETRGAQALALVRANPGITVPNIAAKLAITPNYLYRVLAGLADDGVVMKRDQGWYPTQSS